jgi:hypothetical protein
MIDRVRGHAADQADVVNHAANVWKQLTNLDLVLPKLRELGGVKTGLVNKWNEKK